jgi:hypothetical protein
MAIGLLKPLGYRHFAISSIEEAAVERRRCQYCLLIEPPFDALAATTDPMVTNINMGCRVP